MGVREYLASIVTGRRRLVIVIILAGAVFASAGVADLTQSSSIEQFQSDSLESDKLDYVEANFSTRGADVTTVQIVVRAENVLTRDVLLELLAFQAAVEADDRVGPSITDDSPGGLANVVATAAIRERDGAGPDGSDRTTLHPADNGERPPIDAQIAQLESMSDAEVERVIGTVLQADDPRVDQALVFLPTAFEPGSTRANATVVVLYQRQETQTFEGLASPRTERIQQRIQAHAREEIAGGDVFVLGTGITSEEINRSVLDTILIVGPFAILFVLAVLILAYRDAVDIALGLAGIALVVGSTVGLMGWLGITFNQVFVAIPVLLIGLSIDYAIHTFMRYREQRRSGADPIDRSMRVALVGVGTALVWVTVTTAFGFLSNLISSVPPIREFGLISALGIGITLLVFVGLIPALKVEVDQYLETRGFTRVKPAIGIDGERLKPLLGIGGHLARRSPWLVLVLTAAVSAGGVYGATQVDTSFQERDFVAEDPPAWMKTHLPDALAPGDYETRRNLDYVNDRFLRQDAQVVLLIEGDVTDDDALNRVDAAATAAEDADVAVGLASENGGIRSPVGLMRSVAASNEAFAQRFDDADTDGDGVPDRDLPALYDALFAAAPADASNLIYRDGETYRALRIVVPIDNAAPTDAITREMRAVAATVDGDGFVVTATGQPIVFELVQRSLLETITYSLLITIGTVGVFLLLIYGLTAGAPGLGLVTIVPVTMAVSWILGTMYLAGIPFNIMTGLITSLTIGLGVAYSIHMSDRFVVELDRGSSVEAALETALAGTGGALVGSAATSIGGFGVLVFAILPALQQFGLITALTIAYAFVASVLVLPTLLVLWARWQGIPTGPVAGTAATGRDRAG